ncbi:MAG: MraY family glycosyltransferase [Clostridiaceae bacterium]|nr:MraY family glycosyltransferase [Clostridiaceae bacterium]
MVDRSLLVTSLYACILAVAVAFAMTPLVKIFAQKIGAMDIPKDNRRMHKEPIPRAGGLAIFAGFLVSYLIFGTIDSGIRAILIGAVGIVVLGVLDDVYTLRPLVKFAGQIAAALVPVLAGVRVQSLTNPFSESGYLHLGAWAVPLTVFWIVGITNAVNFIDGLDGLACGVSAIGTITMFTIAVLLAEVDVVVALAALAGACIGFLPYNLNPAKIFMGDTGSMLLGFLLASLSVQGLFKFYAVISFAVPFLLLGLPIFDTTFAIVRRLARGQSPMHADRGHVHHRLIDMGFDTKQSVAILYALSAVLGLSAVVIATSGESKIIVLAIAVLLCFFVGMAITVREKKRAQAAQQDPAEDKQEQEQEEHHE